MSDRVIHFWFLLGFLFIPALFDIPTSLSIPHVVSRDFQAGGNPPVWTFSEKYQILLFKLSLMCEELYYQIIISLGVNQAVVFVIRRLQKLL